MKWLWTVMGLLIVLLQVRLWVGEGSFAQVWQLQERIETQQAENAKLKGRNDQLYAEVRNLRQGMGAMEERARQNLGMIQEGETFFLVVQP
ncbi:cell division protein FtsB [Marinobacteraceae bacterium S3BR75-40.1]